MFSVNSFKKKTGRAGTLSSGRLKKRPRRSFKIFPVTMLGFIVSLIILFLGMLIYTGVVFLTKMDIEYSTTTPLLILLLSVTIGAFVSSLIIRGKSPLPAAILALIFFCFCFYESKQSVLDGSTLSVKGTILKLALIILAAFAGYFLSWLLAIPERRREQARRQARNSRWAS